MCTKLETMKERTKDKRHGCIPDKDDKGKIYTRCSCVSGRVETKTEGH